MEGDVIVTQDIFLYDMEGEDAKGNIIGRHRSTGIGRPRFWDRARYYGGRKAPGRSARRSRSRQRRHASVSGANCANYRCLLPCFGGNRWSGLRILYPYLSGERKAAAAYSERRKQRTRLVRAARGPQKSRRETIETPLKDFEKRRKKSNKRPHHRCASHAPGCPGRNGNSQSSQRSSDLQCLFSAFLSGTGLLVSGSPRFCWGLSVFRAGSSRFSKSGSKGDFWKPLPMRSTSLCVALKPVCRCSIASR